MPWREPEVKERSCFLSQLQPVLCYSTCFLDVKNFQGHFEYMGCDFSFICGFWNVTFMLTAGRFYTLKEFFNLQWFHVQVLDSDFQLNEMFTQGKKRKYHFRGLLGKRFMVLVITPQKRYYKG